MLPLLGLREGVHRPVYVDCGDQMRFRPMRVLITALRTLGMTIESDAFPLRVSGQLIGGEIFIEGYSSQPLSALLIALPAAQKDSVIHVNHLHEAPYIEMTLEWLKKQRIQITRLGNSFYIPGKQTYQPFDYTIPGDYSSASTFFAAAALFPGKITINGLDIDDLQGDKKIIEYVQLPLHGVEINAHDIPDLLPILAVLGTAAAGRTDILNTPGARLKETDRIHSMTQGLRQMGAKIEELSDGLIVYQSSMQGTHVKGFSDHRTVMALTLAGLLAQGTTVIEDAESVNKTYPRFFQDLKSLGAQLELENV
jgi:3-phosphoshikimate 1-carboxyvinyltransferase